MLVLAVDRSRPVTAPPRVAHQALRRRRRGGRRRRARAHARRRRSEPFVAAPQAAHRSPALPPLAGGAHAVGARPEVGGGQLVVAGVEARVEQRVARCARPPRGRSGASASFRAACARAARSRGAAGTAATNQASRARPSGESGGKRRKSPIPLNGYISPSTKKPDADRREAQLVAEPQLLGERDHPLVGGHDHVIEAVDPVPAEVDRAGQAARRAARARAA